MAYRDRENAFRGRSVYIIEAGRLPIEAIRVLMEVVRVPIEAVRVTIEAVGVFVEFLLWASTGYESVYRGLQSTCRG